MNPLSNPVVEQRAVAGLPGFAAEFRDLDHYIRVITDRIWEQRRIDDIRVYYSDPCTVETPLSVGTTVQSVIDGTRATLAQFPDRRLLAEDVIVSGDPVGGLLSSHRIISPMTHAGDGVFGPPTGRKVHARTIADCVCRGNRIVHEWLVRDQAAIALQIGTTPHALARRWLDERGGWTKPGAGAPPAGYVSHVATEPWALRHARGIEAALRGDTSAVADLYDDAVHLIGPGERTCYGHAEVAAFWRSLSGALRVQSFAVEHLAAMRDAAASGRPDRIALRLRAQCVHAPLEASDDRYGPASGRPVELMAIVHAEFVRGRALREWVLIDDVALWMQVLAGPPAA
jgi:predicted ester cyclase